MAEYIRREDYCEENCGKENREGYKTCKNCGMLNIPTADVQPVNQWISVKERQPDKDDLYLVAVENEICVYMDIADYSNNQWHKHDEVIYWQPLPELPKEG